MQETLAACEDGPWMADTVEKVHDIENSQNEALIDNYYRHQRSGRCGKIDSPR